MNFSYRQLAFVIAFIFFFLILEFRIVDCLADENPPKEESIRVLDNTIVAKVDNHILTREDIIIKIKSQIEAWKQGGLSAQEINGLIDKEREKVAKQWVRTRIFLAEARRRNLAVTNDALEKQFEEDLQRARVNLEEFEREIARYGKTVKEYKDDLRNSLIESKVLDEVIRGKLFVKPSEVKAYYDGHQEEFQVKESVRARRIVLRMFNHKNDRKEINRLLQEHLDKLLKAEPEKLGDEFEALAITATELTAERRTAGRILKDDPSSPDWWIEKNKLLEPVEKALFGEMKLGELKIIETEHTSELLMLVDRREGYVMDLQSKYDQVVQILLIQKRKDIVDEFAKELDEKHFVYPSHYRPTFLTKEP